VAAPTYLQQLLTIRQQTCDRLDELTQEISADTTDQGSAAALGSLQATLMDQLEKLEARIMRAQGGGRVRSYGRAV